MKDKYFVIQSSGDGDISIYEYTEKELLKMLKEYGNNLSHILTDLKNNEDPMYWGDSMLIIKGEIKVPIPIETVKEWSI